MSKYPQSFDSMLAAWNELDADQIRGHLEHALSPAARFVDPTIVTEGIDEFEQNVRGFRAKYPDSRCERTSGVDSHHNLHRYSWAIHSGQGLIVAGFDVVETDDAGLVARVEGFFGPLPPKVD